MITYNDYWLAHHGVQGQKWGVQNGPPYPLSRETKARVYGTKRGLINDGYNAIARKVLSRKLGEKDPKTGLYLRSDNLPVEKDIKNVNPYFESGLPGTKNNCVLCSAALELRQRGYDVSAAFSLRPITGTLEIAKMFPGGKFSCIGPTIVKKNFREYWVNDKNAVRESTQLAIRGANRKVASDTIETLSKEKNSRGVIFVDWGIGAGHAMSYDVVNGKVRILDGQDGTIYSSKKQLEGLLSYCASVSSYRFTGDKMNIKLVKENTI